MHCALPMASLGIGVGKGNIGIRRRTRKPIRRDHPCKPFTKFAPPTPEIRKRAWGG